LRHILNYISRSISFNINADDKLKAVFNGKLKGSMFEMNKLVFDTMHPRNGAINTKRIGAQWDEVLQLATSSKCGRQRTVGALDAFGSSLEEGGVSCSR
jgi:hypothetical protein